MTQDEKVKASENKAEQVETKPPDRRIQQMSWGGLALLLNQKYSAIIDMQGHIFAINGELQRRFKVKE